MPSPQGLFHEVKHWGEREWSPVGDFFKSGCLVCFKVLLRVEVGEIRVLDTKRGVRIPDTVKTDVV